MSFSVLDPWPAWLSRYIPPEERSSFRDRVANILGRCAGRWMAIVSSKSLEMTSVERAALTRLERCVLYHWERFAGSELPATEVVVRRLEGGNLGYSKTQSNVIREVIMAQAMEFHDNRATELFVQEYMPTVRSIAQRMSGLRGLDLVENFGADLVLPRATRPPRIAAYTGKTSLASWLRVVVANHCQEAGRREKSVQLVEELDLEGSTADACETSPEHDGCESLLQPIFFDAVSALDSEDRLMIKLLILDEVPQQTLAARMGIHSGNVTRRRQRISQSIWERVSVLRNGSSAPDRVSECLELVLAGGQVELKRSLGDVLVRAIEKGG